jgi:cytochrome c oxidase assembly protein subunit 15
MNAQTEAADTAPAAVRLKGRARPGLVAAWLFVVAGLVICMIVVGGLTRLTDSGLSITEWKPVTGAIPPLSAEDWEAEFAKYREIPEYQLQNRGMTLGEFQAIYWWEWGHRLLGRLLGLVFALPLLAFWLMGAIPQGLKGRLVVLLALGGLQGVVGWWMVASGLSERVDVSQYRLATHLGLAFLLLGATWWTALDARAGAPAPGRP